MGTTGVYNSAKTKIAEKQIDLSTADLRVLLVGTTIGYTFNPNHHTVADITGEEGGTGYVRQQLQGITVTEDDVNNWVKVDANDTLWAGANFNNGAVDAAIVYIENASGDASRQLICSINLNPKITTSGSNYTVSWGANGVLLLQ